jgi:hypothetical protein
VKASAPLGAGDSQDGTGKEKDRMEPARHGLVATTARFVETWFLVVFGGPRTYARHDLPSRYASPGEFVFVLLLINGLASLGYAALFRYSGDSGFSAASAATLLGAMLTVTTTWIALSGSSVIAAKIVRAELQLASIWRVATYSTAPSIIAFPVTGMWRRVLEVFFPSEAISDTLAYAYPTLLIGVWTLTYFFIGIWPHVSRHRIAHAATTLAVVSAFPMAAYAAAKLPAVARMIESTRFAAFGHNPSDSSALWIYGADATGKPDWLTSRVATAGSTITTLLQVRNSSNVTAQNTWVQMRWALDSESSQAIIIARIGCSNCARQYISAVPVTVPRMCALQPAHIDARSAMGNETRTLPATALTDIRRPTGAVIGDVLPGDYAAINIYADYDIVAESLAVPTGAP